jgi:Domain of unknown function (DUF4145)
MSQTASIKTGKSDSEVWVACGSCDRVTHHKALAVVDSQDESPGGEVTVWQSYMIVVCQGCRTVSFCVESTCSEEIDYDPDTGDEFLVKSYELYPSRAAGRPEMDSIHEVPFGICNVYRETRVALCSDQPILAGIGIRAIVEAVCNDRGATGKNLEERIDSLATMKIVTEDGAKILHSLRFMGNSAAHEVKAHKIEELDIAFGVVEYLLQGVYVMPKQAAKLPKQKPAT